MIRNLKVLGLALVAVFAFSALSASVASAEDEQGVLTSDGPVTLTGTETGSEEANSLVVPGLGSTVCPGTTYTGHKVLTHEQTTEEKSHEFLESGDTAATITPHYATKCTATIAILGQRPATVTMNGCDYVFHVGTTTPAENEEGTYGVTADINCPPDQVIELHIYTKTSTEHLPGESICTFKFGDTHEEKEVNQGIKGAHLKHTTAPEVHDFDLTGTFEKIHYTREGSICGSATNNNAALNVDVTIEGHNEAGGDTEVTITDSRP